MTTAMAEAIKSSGRAKGLPRTAAELLRELGDVPPDRVRLDPPPGRATEQDLLDAYDRDNILCELVNGTLVEKGMGSRESILAGAILAALRMFVIPRNLGIVMGEAGMLRLMAAIVRLPDVAYVSWSRLPGARIPEEPVFDLAPDLAVEVLSASNTAKEMTKKRGEYFSAGVRLVWIVDPRDETVAVYTGPENPVILGSAATLDGGEVLPGFALSLAELFGELNRVGPA